MNKFILPLRRRRAKTLSASTPSTRRVWHPRIGGAYGQSVPSNEIPASGRFFLGSFGVSSVIIAFHLFEGPESCRHRRVLLQVWCLLLSGSRKGKTGPFLRTVAFGHSHGNVPFGFPSDDLAGVDARSYPSRSEVAGMGSTGPESTDASAVAEAAAPRRTHLITTRVIRFL